MPKVTLPDGKILDVPAGSTAADAIAKIGKRLLAATYAAEVNGRQVDLSFKLPDNCTLKAFTSASAEGREVLLHSTAHLLAMAVSRLYPEILPTIGPVVEEGFYYDFGNARAFTPEDLAKIEAEMAKIAQENLPIRRVELSKSEALKLFSGNKFKIEMINEIPEGEHSAYYIGDKWCDLCRGPHVPATGVLQAFKLTKVSSAYWRADSANDSLQRIYGISFPEKKMLDEHLALIAEAEKRDHRKIGRELDLYSFQPEAPGMPFFHDKGNIILSQLAEFMTEKMRQRNYEINKTPIILNQSLWLRSGHWDHYKDNMYFTEIDGQPFAVKPMNCPGNMLIFKANSHSYRDLPMRAGEFGLVHRHELSGVLSGLFRVRCFTQDDAHVFCTEEQMKSEIADLIALAHETYSAFGFSYEVELSTRPEKAMGDQKTWEFAERMLKEVLAEKGIPYKVNAGDGAFYGPKIDFHLKDAIGRRWQCGTIQLDMQMPEKFDLTYEGADGKKHRPVMLHRAIYGSFERFLGILVEHYAGKFPVWLAPVQVVLLSVSDPYNEFTESLAARMRESGIRAQADCRQETIGAKIRDAQMQKIPYMLVVGQKEKESGMLAIRTRDGKVEENIPVDIFIARVKKETGTRAC
ncbi:MAG: threonine--tRNA ligase [Candidatus Micrarchaeota archaeon]|nr:threonine--tRNA ligase [Candidatus Micrarchaeota archaeon]